MSAWARKCRVQEHPTSGFNFTHENKDTQRPQVYRLSIGIIQHNQHLRLALGNLLQTM
jgi:hypothetical protein